MTEAELAQYVEMQAKAAIVGASVAVWEIIMCFALGKALNQMWILLGIIQFYVYIGVWRLDLTNIMQIILKEFKRVALGEFMDDLDISTKAMDLLGIPSAEKDPG